MKKHYLPSVSIVIRTLNEEKFLPECLSQIQKQNYDGHVEVVIVDSGSTDGTEKIATTFEAKIIRISKSEFTFGRSLNLGCAASSGELLVLLSAHCIPCDENWLLNLTTPLLQGVSEYAYGRQIPRHGVSKFSEGMVFKKYYPEHSKTPQTGFFCNNANSAITRKTWERFRFDECLTGLEDMALAKRLVASGGTVSYVASSAVEHIHEEGWNRIKIRYEREAAALVDIEPNLNLSFMQALYLFLLSVIHDIIALDTKSLLDLGDVIRYRASQYHGSFVGSRASKLHINKMRSEYFYPTTQGNVVNLGDVNDHNRIAADESPQ